MDMREWAARSFKVFDPDLMEYAAASTVEDELKATLKLALQCVDPSPSDRPTAGEVLRQLEQIRPESDAGVMQKEKQLKQIGQGSRPRKSSQPRSAGSRRMNRNLKLFGLR
ncbi:hypothetical protein EJB05_29381, partial [Eragrostis curvula]